MIRKEVNILGKTFMDLEDGDICFSISDNIAMDSDGNLLMKMSDNMVMDMDTGDLHIISRWKSDDNEW